jgi:cation transport ATPase
MEATTRITLTWCPSEACRDHAGGCAPRERGWRPEDVSVDQLNAGDQVLVKAGEKIPIDGRILGGWPRAAII